VRGFLPVFAVAPAVTLGLGSLPLSRRFSVRRAVTTSVLQPLLIGGELKIHASALLSRILSLV